MIEAGIKGIMHLTYHPNRAHTGAVSTASAAPGLENEITPKMLDAGLGEFHTYDSRFDFPEEVVTKIYRAMRRAS